MAGLLSVVEEWRYLETLGYPGDLNMALDVALAAKSGKPVLRLFTWSPFAISLGFHQKPDDVNPDLCRHAGYDVVKRPTGGRAILHAAELTYSVILPQTSAFYHKDILPVYDTISRCLVSGLESLGFPVEFERAEKTPHGFNRGELSSLCYASSVQHEITIKGRKLVGSAQRRYEFSVLQHGSILIGEEHLDLPLYLNRGDEKRRLSMKDYMRRHTICLSELDPNIRIEQVMNALKLGFEQQLVIRLTTDKIGEEEMSLAQSLRPEYSVSKN